MKISIVIDNPKSWIAPYAEKLRARLAENKHEMKIVNEYARIEKGDIAIFLSCENIAKSKILSQNQHNLIVHESDLPKGRGWSPLTWQVLEGKNKIPVVLFEAGLDVDNGDIYFKENLEFKGHELVDEMRQAQGLATIRLVLKFIESYPKIRGKKQIGRSSYYRRRLPEDSRLDINKTIKEQFNLLRVADNERYPAFFKHKGQVYIVKIYKKR